MAFHLKEARKHVYRDFNSVVCGTTLSEDFLEAVDDLYNKQQCAYNTAFNDKIQYDVEYTFNNEHGNINLEGVQDMDSLMIDIMLNHFRHQEAHKFQDKGSIIRKLMRERRGHESAKIIVVNYDLGQSTKVSWGRFMDLDTSEHRPRVQEIADDSKFEATPQMETSAAYNKENKASIKKTNKRKSKPTNVENLASKVQDDYNNMEEADTSKNVAVNPEVTDYGVKSTTAMGNVLGELSRSVSTTTIHGSMESFGEAETFVNPQPTTENNSSSQGSELVVPLTEIPASLGDSTIVST